MTPDQFMAPGALPAWVDDAVPHDHFLSLESGLTEARNREWPGLVGALAREIDRALPALRDEENQ